MREAVEGYPRAVGQIHRSGGGVKETSYYGSLEALFNEVGKGLTPKVRCIVHVKNVGGGIPDGGLFTADQLLGVEDTGRAMLDVPVPARGVIEVKGAGEDLGTIAASAQVRTYLGTYGQVLVTNLRGFLLVERGENGEPRLRERFELAAGEGLFWEAVRDPAAMWEEVGERFWEFLRRMPLMRAPLTEPRFLAFFHGVFSAWVLWSKGQKPGATERFDWRDTIYLLHVPAITEIFHQIASGTTLRRLGLTETLDWAGAALNRVERGAYSAKFEEDAAVQYFYEPFLEAFDPEPRRQLGVWYGRSMGSTSAIRKIWLLQHPAVLRQPPPNGLREVSLNKTVTRCILDRISSHRET